MAHIFISYQREDVEFVRLLRDRCEAEGFTTWTDHKLSAGDDWRRGIDNAIRDCFALIVLVTPESDESKYVTYEWAYALGVGVPVIPLLVKPADLHPRLEVLQHLDFTAPDSYPWDDLVGRIKALFSQHDLGIDLFLQDAPQAVKMAVKQLDSHVPEEREWAIETMAQANHESAVAALNWAMNNHTIRDVRGHAAVILAELDQKPSAAALVDALYHSNPDVRGAASDALVTRSSSETITRIMKLLKHRDPQLRQTGAVTLGKMNKGEATRTLLTMLAHPDRAVQHDAIAALEISGTPAAIQTLCDIITHTPDADIRRTAISGLMKVASPNAVKRLLEFYVIDRYKGVVLNAAKDPVVSAQVEGRLVELLYDAGEPKQMKWLAASILQDIGSAESRAALDRWRKQTDG